MSQQSNPDYTSVLVAAHRGATATRPESLPSTLAEAMRVQREVFNALGAEIAGWKIGFSPDKTPVAGPLYASLVQRSPATRRVPRGGFIIEIELAFRLARDLPKRAYTREEILDAASEALIGIELVRGRFGEPPDVPYAAFVGDNVGNAGYVIGGSTSAFRSLDVKALPLRFEIDGEIVEDKTGGHPQGDPVEPLRAYAERPIDELGGLKKGQLITTGSLSKPLRLERAAKIVASLGGIGTVDLTLER